MKNGSKIIESIESFKKATDIEPGKAFEELKLKADIQPVASFELAKTIESTKKHLETAKKNLEPCLKAAEELVKDTATEESKDRFETPKTKELKAMGLSEGIKKSNVRVINESTLDDRVLLGTLKLDDAVYYVTGDKTHTKNYHYEEIKIEGRDKNSFTGYSVVGFGRYRWMNRPWQKYEFSVALETAFIDWKPEHKEEIRKIVEENSSAKGALVQLAKMLGGVLEESVETKVEESVKETKSLKESVESELFYSHFGTTSEKFQNVVENILKRLDLEDLKKKVLADEDVSEEVYQAMDEELIYTDDQWTCMKYYQSPKEANFDQMWEDLTTDIIVAIEHWAKESEY